LAGFDVDRPSSNRITATKDNIRVLGGANEPVGELGAELFVTVNVPAPEPPDIHERLEPLSRALSSP
jgi:hypothetical protein